MARQQSPAAAATNDDEALQAALAAAQGGAALLDAAREMLLGGRAGDAVAWLVEGLRRLKPHLGPETWRLFCDSVCAEHPTRALIHQSPFARRAFEKPRGYAGDAETLDLVYGIGAPRATSMLGAEIYDAELRSASSRGVCERRDMLASIVDAAAERRPSARVLSVACGHLREAEISAAVASGRLGAYFALDQDAASLARIDREQRHARITTVPGTVKSLLAWEIVFSDLDLVYAAGLYDYLPVDAGRALAAALFAMLGPGGRLVIANVAPNWDAVGYMEAFMAWKLIYRTEAEVAALASAITERAIDHLRLYRNPSRNIVFLEVVKRGA
jgi:hypothetical protein